MLALPSEGSVECGLEAKATLTREAAPEPDLTLARGLDTPTGAVSMSLSNRIRAILEQHRAVISVAGLIAAAIDFYALAKFGVI